MVLAHPPTFLNEHSGTLHCSINYHSNFIEALQEIAATLNVEAQHLDLEAALFQKEGEFFFLFLISLLFTFVEISVCFLFP